MEAQVKISYSVIKDMYNNFWHHELSKKELVRKFLQDKKAIASYIEDLKHDIKIVGSDMDMTSYKKGVEELGLYLF
jgi:hypothetical protein